MLWKAFSKSTYLMCNCVCHSVYCLMMLLKVKIWPVNHRPSRKPACSCLSRWSTASGIMRLAMILLGTDRKMIILQLLQLLRAPFFGIFTMTPSVQSSNSFCPPILLQRVAEQLCYKLWLCLEEFYVEADISCPRVFRF